MTITHNAPMIETQPRPTVLARFLRNPILVAEARHQWFIIEKSRSGRGWIALAVLMLLPALLASLIYFVGGLLGWKALPAFPAVGQSALETGLAVAMLLMLVMNISLYVVVILITLGLSANSVSREKTGRTWETLVLTNIDAGRVVLGKWWASLQALWGDHVMIFLLRLGLVAWLVLALNTATNWALAPAPFGLSPNFGYIPPLVAIMAAYTFLDATFTAAMGVGLSLSNWSGVTIATFALTTRLILFVLSGLWFIQMFAVLRAYGGFSYVPLALGGLALFALATWLMLRLGYLLAVRGEVSPAG